MSEDQEFQIRYREIDARMRALAESDGDVYLPNPEPEAPVDYVLVCMEPSLGAWARSPEEARRKVEAGFRNFLTSMEATIVHFCARHYLCRADERYHITDISKGAMLVENASESRTARYERWFPLLRAEIEVVARPDAGIIAVGQVAERFLRGRFPERPTTSVIHYSGLAGAARNAAVKGREEEFEEFRSTVSQGDLVRTAEDILGASPMPLDYREEALQLVKRGRFTPHYSQSSK